MSEQFEKLSDLSAADGVNSIAYCYHPRKAPTVLFLHGFRSDMTGTKAGYLAELCARQDLGYCRFDLRGHGKSSGHYTEFTVGDWVQDVLLILDTVVKGPVLLVGSSLGAWLALCALRARPSRVAGLIGIAPAADFPTRLILPQLTPAQRDEYARHHQITDPDSGFGEPTRFTRRLIEESVAHNLYDAPPPCSGKMRFLQGMKDTAVPWQHTAGLVANMTTGDVQLTLIRGGDHRLNEPEHLHLLGRMVLDLAGERPA